MGWVAGCSAPGDASALASVPAPQDSASGRPLPKIETRVAAGFRIYRPGYRLSGKGALVTAQVCRLPGWAGQGPGHVEVERIASGGDVAESHLTVLPRLGMHAGNNCAAAAVKLEQIPDYGENVRICAVSGRLKCE